MEPLISPRIIMELTPEEQQLGYPLNVDKMPSLVMGAGSKIQSFDPFLGSAIVTVMAMSIRYLMQRSIQESGL